MIRIISLAAAAFLLTASALAQTPAWQPSRAAIKLERGTSGTLADLTGDGHLDILTRRQGRNELVLLLGTGQGTTGPIADVKLLAYEPGATLVADVDGDRKPDIVVASRDEAGEYIQVLPGRDSFSLRTTGRFRFSDAGEFYKPLIAAADFNEDGKLDLLAGNGRRADLGILIGDGKGGFTLGAPVHIGLMPGRYYADIGDVNGDGHTDIVAAGNKGEDPAWLLVRLGDGKGGFSNGSELRLPAEFGTRIEIGDLNGDRRPDVLLSYGNELGVYINDGKGVFARSPGSPGNVGREVFETEIADLNGDMRQDIVVATQDSVTVLLGNGTGFTPARGSPFAAGPGAYFIEVGDLNEDGKPDVLSNSFEGDSLALLLGG